MAFPEGNSGEHVAVWMLCTMVRIETLVSLTDARLSFVEKE